MANANMNTSLWTNDRLYCWQTSEKAPGEIDTFFEHIDQNPARLATILQQTKTICEIEDSKYDHVVQLYGNELNAAQKIAVKIQEALLNKQQILMCTSIQEEFAAAFKIEAMFGSTHEPLDIFLEKRLDEYLYSGKKFTKPEILLGKIQIYWSATQESKVC